MDLDRLDIDNPFEQQLNSDIPLFLSLDRDKWPIETNEILSFE